MKKTILSISALLLLILFILNCPAIPASDDDADKPKDGSNSSSVSSGTPPNTVIAPAFSISGGTYTTEINVYLSTSTLGASIRYTTDGSAPTANYGTVSTYASIKVSSSAAIKAIAYKTGMSDSILSEAIYIIKVKTPVLSLAEGSYTSAQSVSITVSTDEAAIRYTTNGSDPSSSYGTIYTGSIILPLGATTVKAIAYKTGLADSDIKSASYTIFCTQKWTFTAKDDITSSPAISNDGNTIYAGSRDSNLYAINASDGTKKWSFAAPSPFSSVTTPINSTPAVGTDGTIYIGTAKYDCKLYALTDNGNSYTLKWEYAGTDNISSPAISNDGSILYFGCDDGSLYALNTAAGAKYWSYYISNSVGSPVIGSGGTIYVSAYYGKLYAINPDGTLKWSWSDGTGSGTYNPIIGSDGTIYVGKDKLYAITDNGSSCTVNWTYAVSGSCTIANDGTIYVTGNSKLSAINPDGTLKWVLNNSGLGISMPAIGKDGNIYIGGTGDYFFAISPNGAIIWSLYTSDWTMSSPAIGNDGVIYFGTDGNFLYALNTLSGGLADTPWPKFRKNNQNTARH